MVRSMYYRERPIIVPLHTSVCLIDSSIIRKLCMVVWCLMVVVEGWLATRPVTWTPGCQYVPHTLQRLVIHELKFYHDASV